MLALVAGREEGREPQKGAEGVCKGGEEGVCKAVFHYCHTVATLTLLTPEVGFSPHEAILSWMSYNLIQVGH